MKLPIFLTKHYLWTTLNKCGILFLGIFGAIWLVIEPLSVFWPPGLEWVPGGGPTILSTSFGVALLSAILCFWCKSKALLSVTHGLYGTDVSIEIRVGDILKMEGALIISTNTTFDTDMSFNSNISDSHLISPESLQGQFTKKYYNSREALLDIEIKEALENVKFITVDNPIGKTKRYEIGTTVKVHPKNLPDPVYLLAIANIDQKGRASSTPENVLRSLTKLWQFISAQGGYGNLVIPVLGTGRARVQVKIEQMVMEIIKSFIAACSEEKFCKKLTVVIFERDYIDNSIDLVELGRHLHVHATEKRLRIQESKEPVGESI